VIGLFLRHGATSLLLSVAKEQFANGSSSSSSRWVCVILSRSVGFGKAGQTDDVTPFLVPLGA